MSAAEPAFQREPIEPDRKHSLFLKVLPPLPLVLLGGIPACLTYFRGAAPAIKDLRRLHPANI
jgi:hypothetical protein